jgi:hypothetical protein
MVVWLQLLTLHPDPLNWTPWALWLAPKLLPLIVTAVLAGPDVGEMLVMIGEGSTVNKTPLLAFPPTVTNTFPVLAPFGTSAII